MLWENFIFEQITTNMLLSQASNDEYQLQYELRTGYNDCPKVRDTTMDLSLRTHIFPLGINDKSTTYKKLIGFGDL